MYKKYLTTICFTGLAISQNVIAQSADAPLCVNGMGAFATRASEFGGGTGVSLADAVIFRNPFPEKTDSSESLIRYERNYLRRCFIEYRLIKQELIKNNGLTYDAMTIESSSGQKTVYFDISQFFPKQ